MTDSSDEHTSRLAGLEVKPICRLLDVVSQAEIRELQHVERTYLEHARSFLNVLTFLKDIKWIEENKGAVELTAAGRKACDEASDETKIRLRLVDAITKKSSAYRHQVSAYVCQYSFNGTELIYRPSVEERLQQSSIRDFMMDLRVVSYRRSDNAYVLTRESNELFLWARNAGQSTSKNGYISQAAKQDALGQRAELAVLAYERTRVGEKWSSLVEHVSGEIPFACYDIKSVSIVGTLPTARYIEVKAVPRDTFHFYWSKVELEIAQLLAEQYFLYLLPVTPSGFLVEEMLIVSDPHRTIYCNSVGWKTEENVIACSKR